ncbi:MAG TPA: hypothetical protein VIV61_03920 [Candidatus Ozemobacteraceae bacterium]
MNPTNPTPLFDRDEMIRLSREGLENAMKFYTTLTENITKIADMQRDAYNDTAKKQIEMVNKAYEDYQKNTRVVMHHFENVWRQVIEQASPKAKAAE